MENKINIAEILRDCPKGTKLYSPVCGSCTFLRVANSAYYPIMVKRVSDTTLREDFTKDGRYTEGVEDSECVLFPSAEIRDWDKFFKHGDVVSNESSGLVAVFDCWTSYDYTEFYTTINLIKKGDFWGEKEVCDTECFTKVTDEERAEFIAAAEKHYGGKYNPETRLDRLRIECDELRARSKELDAYLNEGYEKSCRRDWSFIDYAARIAKLVLAQIPGRTRSTPFNYKKRVETLEAELENKIKNR